MVILAAASLAFLLTHFGISSTPLRAWLLARLPEPLYLLIYSLLALLTLGLMIHAYAGAPRVNALWPAAGLVINLNLVIMPIALMLLVSGLMIKNPTAVKMQEVVHQPTGYQMPGILKVTRHPVQWGILLWALGHLLANTDTASLIFFGTFACLSSLGPVAMDHRGRLRCAQDPQWQQFYAMTSNLPFQALLQGRNRLALTDLNWIALVMGLTLFVVLYHFHALFTGVPLASFAP